MNSEPQTFVPLSVRNGNRGQFEPVEGIPDFLRPSIDGWLNRVVIELTDLVGGLTEDHLGAKILADLRISPTGFDSWTSVLNARVNETIYLDIIDYLCKFSPPPLLRELDGILSSSGHVYRVDVDSRCLVERVEPTSYEMYIEASSPEDSASEFISDAWTHAFGRSPNAEAAWRAAIKAVENLLGPIASPKNSAPTLGVMMSDLRTGEKNFVTVFSDAYGKDGALAETGMARFRSALSLISYEPGRHGTDPARPSLEEARAIVLQAATVVSWLRSGALKRLAFDDATND